jgi:hypothetical protein
MQAQALPAKKQAIMRGLSFVAPPDPFPTNPFPAVQAVGADWIAVIPFAYTRLGTPEVFYNQQKWQWWGERPEGCRETIQKAQAAGLKIMLKPQVYIPGGWPGGLDFEDEASWQAWEQSYEQYLLQFAIIAEELQVELLCIGTEFKLSSTKRPGFWRQLIEKVRDQYSGQLTYAANWDEYQAIEFWDELDYIGVDAYFPLVKVETPSVKSLIKAWKSPKREMQAVALQFKKPILFTEYGYLSVDGCTYNNWELEGEINSLNINEQAQANALEALFQAFWQEPYWQGGFLWKWFPNGEGHEGYAHKDYTPQGKMAEQTLKNWYTDQ